MLLAALGGMRARTLLGFSAEAAGVRAGTQISRHLDLQQSNTAVRKKKV